MAAVMSGIMKNLFQMDYVGARTDPITDSVTYIFKTTSVSENLTEVKAKVLSLFDLPVDIPTDVKVTLLKRGPVFRDYLVEITVKSNKVGKVSNLLAKKYGLIRKRPYTS